MLFFVFFVELFHKGFVLGELLGCEKSTHFRTSFLFDGIQVGVGLFANRSHLVVGLMQHGIDLLALLGT